MPAPVPTIVAIGGGGLTTDAADQRLDDFILSLSGAERPRVCYLPTAGGDRDSSIVEFYRTLAGRGTAPSHLSLFRRDSTDLTAHLLAQDVVYVGGGNTANMLAIWRVHGLDRARDGLAGHVQDAIDVEEDAGHQGPLSQTRRCDGNDAGGASASGRGGTVAT